MSEFSYLRLVANEVHFRFAWLRSCRRWNFNFWCLFRFLHQDIDKRSLLVLKNWRQLWDRRCRWGGSFDENDLVMFLWWRCWWNVLWGFVFRGFRWWNVNVNMFMNDRMRSRDSVSRRWIALSGTRRRRIIR